jgi:hypothetical protein
MEIEMAAWPWRWALGLAIGLLPALAGAGELTQVKQQRFTTHNFRLDARFVELESPLGHSASGLDAETWAPDLTAFMARLVPPAT